MLLHDAAFRKNLLSGINLGTAIATLKAVIDDLVERGGIMVCYFHTVSATVDGNNPTSEHIAEILAYVQQYAQEGKLRAIHLEKLKTLLQSRVVV
jgi:endonuclease IV